ncbi:patatin-like phospholipase family protein [Methyloglobulus sp.]|uniref:patatin-like phospholipase family protein n=1 Tax=Methyloglobulus sp. TaxID=2518622 RepID=UPI00398A4E62
MHNEPLPPLLPKSVDTAPPRAWKTHCDQPKLSRQIHKQTGLTSTRASKNLTIDDLPNGVLIGIAMSGGGSRAANFSTAVLLELEKLGILQKTAVISSVSGSSLVAAYYGLYGCDPELWNPTELRNRFRTNFELFWLGRWLDPRNIARYWFTNFNRSDMMLQEIDSKLFDEKQFKDMNQGRSPIPGTPRILINATSYTNGLQFVFSDEQFEDRLNSRLDTYPVANAVMASSSFPVVFHDITLKDYTIKDRALSGDELGDATQNYEHLIDGGPSDNLGVEPLVNIVDKLYKNPQKPKGCFLFVADAFPYQELSEDVQKADTRHWYDFFLDTNVAASSDVLLFTRRVGLMRDLGVNVTSKDLNPYVQAKEDPKKPIEHCNIWHLTFQRMYAPSFERDVKLEEPDQLRLLRQIRKVVNGTPTRYKLTEVQGYSPESVQDYLFKAANILVKNDNIEDKDGNPVLIYKDVCKKMTVFGFKDLQCD